GVGGGGVGGGGGGERGEGGRGGRGGWGGGGGGGAPPVRRALRGLPVPRAQGGRRVTRALREPRGPPVLPVRTASAAGVTSRPDSTSPRVRQTGKRSTAPAARKPSAGGGPTGQGLPRTTPESTQPLPPAPTRQGGTPRSTTPSLISHSATTSG